MCEFESSHRYTYLSRGARRTLPILITSPSPVLPLFLSLVPRSSFRKTGAVSDSVAAGRSGHFFPSRTITILAEDRANEGVPLVNGRSRREHQSASLVVIQTMKNSVRRGVGEGLRAAAGEVETPVRERRRSRAQSSPSSLLRPSILLSSLVLSSFCLSFPRSVANSPDERRGTRGEMREGIR